MTLIAFALTRDDLPSAVADACCLDGRARAALLARLADDPAIRGAAVLSTCRRLEVLLDAAEVCRARRRARACIARATGLPGTVLDASWTERRGPAAVLGRFARVACGLESAVLGESEVLGQVRAASQEAVDAATASPTVRALFDAALRAGRRARHETRIARGAQGLALLGADLLRRALPQGANHPRILVLGAGPIARQLAERLAESGARLAVASRTPSRARALAAAVGGEAIALEDAPARLAGFDAAAAAIASGRVLLDAAAIATAPRVAALLDLSAPAAIARPDGDSTPAFLGLAEVEAAAKSVRREREGEIAAVEAIVAEESERFARWMTASSTRALADDVMRSADARRRAAVDRLAAGLPPSERLRAEAFSHRLMAALLGGIAENIRSLDLEDESHERFLRGLLEAAPPRRAARVDADRVDEGRAGDSEEPAA